MQAKHIVLRPEKEDVVGVESFCYLINIVDREDVE